MIIKSLNYDGTSVNPLESLSSRPSPRPYYIHRSPPEFPFFLSRQWRVKPGYKGTSPLYIYKTPRQTRAKGEPNSTFLFRRVSERKDTRYIARFSRNETPRIKFRENENVSSPTASLVCCLVTKRVMRKYSMERRHGIQMCVNGITAEYRILPAFIRLFPANESREKCHFSKTSLIDSWTKGVVWLVFEIRS